MGLLDRIEMIEAKDAEKMLDRSINDMQETLAIFHQKLAELMIKLNLHEQQYNQSVTQAKEWERKVILATQKGEENLTRQALSRKKTYADSAATLKAGLDNNLSRVEVFKKVIEMQTELVQLRQTLEQSMATLKNKEAEYNQCTLQLQEWDQRSLLALQNDDENLANENLSHKLKYVRLAETLKSELDLQLMQIDTLKKNFITIAIKRIITETTLIECNFPTGLLIQNDACFSTSDEMSMDELESRLTKLEADSSVDPELAALWSLTHQVVLPPDAQSDNTLKERNNHASEISERMECGAFPEKGAINSSFVQLEVGCDVDEELAALKVKIMADSLAHQIVSPPSNAAKIVDEELAALKAKIMADSLAHQIVSPPSDAAK